EGGEEGGAVEVEVEVGEWLGGVLDEVEVGAWLREVLHQVSEAAEEAAAREGQVLQEPPARAGSGSRVLLEAREGSGSVLGEAGVQQGPLEDASGVLDDAGAAQLTARETSSAEPAALLAQDQEATGPPQKEPGPPQDEQGPPEDHGSEVA
ncbi:hypothetical protein T484DRAFT_1881977, partial [Baffinella frigidus]